MPVPPAGDARSEAGNLAAKGRITGGAAPSNSPSRQGTGVPAPSPLRESSPIRKNKKGKGMRNKKPRTAFPRILEARWRRPSRGFAVFLALVLKQLRMEPQLIETAPGCQIKKHRQGEHATKIVSAHSIPLAMVLEPAPARAEIAWSKGKAGRVCGPARPSPLVGNRFPGPRPSRLRRGGSLSGARNGFSRTKGRAAGGAAPGGSPSSRSGVTAPSGAIRGPNSK